MLTLILLLRNVLNGMLRSTMFDTSVDGRTFMWSEIFPVKVTNSQKIGASINMLIAQNITRV